MLRYLYLFPGTSEGEFLRVAELRSADVCARFLHISTSRSMIVKHVSISVSCSAGTLKPFTLSDDLSNTFCSVSSLINLQKDTIIRNSDLRNIFSNPQPPLKIVSRSAQSPRQTCYLCDGMWSV